MREIKKILVLAYEYFPMENANTKIVRNLCGLLAESRGVDLVTSEKPGMPGPAYDGQVHVIRVPEYSFHRDKRTGQLTPGILARMVSAKIREGWTMTKPSRCFPGCTNTGSGKRSVFRITTR